VKAHFLEPDDRLHRFRNSSEKKLFYTDWASEQAGILRAVSQHGIALAYRSRSSRSQKVNTLKQVIQATLKDTEANIGNLINQDR
ncbi:unnamed protein product, partial [Effrenium voratum]